MKRKSARMLPKTFEEVENGGLYQQSIRCGKSNCRCASGDLHQGYFYFIRRIDGRLRKTYVPKSQAENIATLIREARNERAAERSTRISDRALLAELRARFRENDALIRTLAEALKQDGWSLTNY